MNEADSECIAFATPSLIPGAWRGPAADGPVRAFNPALLRNADHWIMAYRVVLPDGVRRIAFCRLDSDFAVIADSAVPFCDGVRFPADSPISEVGRQWFADPRLYRWGERLFVYWNSGWHEPQNHQFLQEVDPHRLTPLGPPRELFLRGGDRRPLEKNWTMFTREDGVLLAVYAIAPHRILRFDLAGTGGIGFEDVATTPWSLSLYPACHGGLRGGAPPVWHEGKFWSFCHSVHDGPRGYRYAAAVYCFSGHGSFPPVAEPRHPLELGGPHRRERAFPRLNPAVDEVIYPCGAVFDRGAWWVSHGVNDERCAISRLAPAAAASSLQPLAPG